MQFSHFQPHQVKTFPLNITSEFMLVGFSFPLETIPAFFFMFLIAYLITMAGNILIITLYNLYPGLNMPMYFFLCNLAILDIIFINIIGPVLLRGLINTPNKISVTGCLTQSYLYFLVGTTQFFLLDVMCYDRYLAICRPLHYPVIMHKKMCIRLVIGAWLCSFCCILLPSVMTMKLTYCFYKINHFFCDVGPLLRNSCSDSSFVQLLVLLSSGSLLFSLTVAAISYTNIMLTIYKIKSAKGRKKVFSTCSSHAIVVSLFFGSCIFMYIKPVQYQGVDEYDKNVAVLNTVVVPLINPYIYTLRNQIVNNILRSNRR